MKRSMAVPRIIPYPVDGCFEAILQRTWEKAVGRRALWVGMGQVGALDGRTMIRLEAV